MIVLFSDKIFVDLIIVQARDLIAMDSNGKSSSHF